jgi:hypothetical protein
VGPSGRRIGKGATIEVSPLKEKISCAQRILQTAWDDAIAQSADQKISEKNFPKFWMTLRQKALEKAGLQVVYYPE